MRFPLWRRRQEDDLQQEIHTHLAMAAQDRIDRGETRAQAEAAVRRQFGNPLLVREITREMWGWTSLERLWQDLRYAVRLLAKSPSFAAIAILTLALGIGANTALFSVVNGVLLNPLPYPHSEQVLSVFESKPHFTRGSFSYLNLLDFQQRNRTLVAIAGYRGAGYSLTGSGIAEAVRAQMLSADFFSLLGVHPILGRDFTKGEDRLGTTPVVILGAEFWQRKFAGSPDVIGRSITLDGSPYVVIGVMPGRMDLAIQNFRRQNDIYVLMGQYAVPRFRDRTASWGTDAVARLKPGATIDQARADLGAIALSLGREYPEVNKGIGITLVPLKDEILGEVRPILLLLLGAVTFVLLIACGNVANLLLARSTARQREIAVRAALGASQGRLVRQLLTESVLLSLLGGAIGLVLAAWSTSAAIRLLPVGALPRPGSMGLDARVLFFTFAIAMLSALVFGLTPALKTTSLDLHSTLKEAGRGSSGTRHRAQSAFVVVEMAMALVLLAGAGLMVRSLIQMWRADPGFNPHDLTLLGVNLPPALNHAPAAAIRASLRQLEDAIRRTPGVDQQALSAGAIPFRGDDEDQFWIEGQPRPAAVNEMNWTLTYFIQPNYSAATQLPLRRGRWLSDQDNESAPRVAVIDDAFAARYFPGADPIGAHIHLANLESMVEIVGVVGHARQWGLAHPESSLQAEIYVPLMQTGDPFISNVNEVDVLVRSGLPPTVITDAIRGAVQPVNRDYVVFGGESMDSIIAQGLAIRRFSMILLATFAALALALACIGLYGVVSYGVGQRTHEIGIRMALGARRADVLRMVLRQGAMLAIVGVVIGLAAAFALTRLMNGMLYGVRAVDPLTFSLVPLLLASIAIVACYAPARRAMLVDPMAALRHE